MFLLCFSGYIIVKNRSIYIKSVIKSIKFILRVCDNAFFSDMINLPELVSKIKLSQRETKVAVS